MPGHPANPFLTGRLVALGFMTLSVLAVWWVARPRNYAVTFLAVGLFLLLHPVTANAAFLKNDGTALFFSLLALLVVRVGARSQLHLAGAALCCVLALASKQIFISASAACFVYLLLRQRAAAFRFGLYFLLFAAVLGVVAQAWWGNGFWFCVMHAPRVPFDSGQFATQWGIMLRQPVFVLLLASWLVTAATFLYQRRGREMIGNPFFLHFLFAVTILFLSIGKPGSSTNYFIEPCLAGICWLVSMTPPLLGRTWIKAAITSVCLVVACWEIASATTRSFAFADPSILEWRWKFHDSLLADATALARGAKRLRVLNLATASTFHDWPGETSVNDPYLYSLLWKQGVLDPEPMRETLRDQRYDLIVFRKDTMLVPAASADGLGQIMETMREFYRPLKSESLFQYWIRTRQPQTQEASRQ